MRLTGFVPDAIATLRSYGIPQDEAARTNAPAPAQDIAMTNFPAASAGFSYSFATFVADTLHVRARGPAPG